MVSLQMLRYKFARIQPDGGGRIIIGYRLVITTFSCIDYSAILVEVLH